MKFALVSHVLPPASSGQAMVLHRMLQQFGRDEYCLVTAEPAAEDQRAYTEPLDVPRYQLPPPVRINRGHRFGLRYLREGINIPLTVFQHARFLTKLLLRERCDMIVGCTGDLTHLPAAMLASRRAGIPFHAYIFDHYVYREWQDPAAAFWARRFERSLLKNAGAVIVPNAILRDDLKMRFGIEATVIHNALDITPYRSDSTYHTAETRREYRIVYTGDIYEAHFDAFRNLLEAVSALDRSDIRVHIYTDRQIDMPAELAGVLVRHKHVAASEIPVIQMNADVLFLPLAFESPYPELVRTSSTTKLGEYLAACKPILVHAPTHSFISEYVRQYDCGVVVGENDPRSLASAVTEVLANATLREKLTANAWNRAQSDFDIVRARQCFRELLGIQSATSAAVSHRPGFPRGP